MSDASTVAISIWLGVCAAWMIIIGVPLMSNGKVDPKLIGTALVVLGPLLSYVAVTIATQS